MIQISLVIIVMILIFIIIKKYLLENYTSKREKANTISDWFKSTSSPAYVDYKNNVPDSDVVEYTQVKELYKQGTMNADNVEAIIR